MTSTNTCSGHDHDRQLMPPPTVLPRRRRVSSSSQKRFADRAQHDSNGNEVSMGCSSTSRSTATQQPNMGCRAPNEGTCAADVVEGGNSQCMKVAAVTEDSSCSILADGGVDEEFERFLSEVSILENTSATIELVEDDYFCSPRGGASDDGGEEGARLSAVTVVGGSSGGAAACAASDNNACTMEAHSDDVSEEQCCTAVTGDGCSRSGESQRGFSYEHRSGSCLGGTGVFPSSVADKSARSAGAEIRTDEAQTTEVAVCAAGIGDEYRHAEEQRCYSATNRDRNTASPGGVLSKVVASGRASRCSRDSSLGAHSTQGLRGTAIDAATKSGTVLRSNNSVHATGHVCMYLDTPRGGDSVPTQAAGDTASDVVLCATSVGCQQMLINTSVYSYVPQTDLKSSSRSIGTSVKLEKFRSELCDVLSECGVDDAAPNKDSVWKLYMSQIMHAKRSSGTGSRSGNANSTASTSTVAAMGCGVPAGGVDSHVLQNMRTAGSKGEVSGGSDAKHDQNAKGTTESCAGQRSGGRRKHVVQLLPSSYVDDEEDDDYGDAEIGEKADGGRSDSDSCDGAADVIMDNGNDDGQRDNYDDYGTAGSGESDSGLQLIMESMSSEVEGMLLNGLLKPMMRSRHRLISNGECSCEGSEDEFVVEIRRRRKRRLVGCAADGNSNAALVVRSQ